jgi:hypothetical protein
MPIDTIELKIMPSQSPIADREFDLLPPGKSRVRLTVRFGPIYHADGSYRCPVRFEGWGDQPPDIFGDDSLQAFLLAVTCMNSILRCFIARGGRVLFPDTNDDMPLEIISTEQSTKS